MDSPTINGSKKTGTFPKVRELIKKKKGKFSRDEWKIIKLKIQMGRKSL